MYIYILHSIARAEQAYIFFCELASQLGITIKTHSASCFPWLTSLKEVHMASNRKEHAAARTTVAAHFCSPLLRICGPSKWLEHEICFHLVANAVVAHLRTLALLLTPFKFEQAWSVLLLNPRTLHHFWDWEKDWLQLPLMDEKIGSDDLSVSVYLGPVAA